MPQLVGRQSPLYTLAQAAAGTLASGNYHPVFHQANIAPRKTDPLVDDPLVGRALNNVLDSQEPATGLIEAGLDVTLPLCLNQIGFHLPHLLSAASPSGADPYTHVFTSGAREHAGGSYIWPESTKWKAANTVTWSRMEFGLGAEAGRRTVRFSGMASNIATLGSDPLGTPTTQLALNSVPAGVGCTIRKNSVALAQVIGGNLFYERPLVPFRPVGRADRTALSFTPNVGGGIGGNIELRVLDIAFHELAEAKDVDDWEFEFASGDDSLVLACPALRLEPSQRPVSGEGLRTESYSVRSEQTASAPALTATLTNSIATYPAES